MSNATPARMPLIDAYQRSRLLLIVAIGIALTIFWWAGELFHLPYLYRESASILQMPGAAVGLLVVLVALLLSTAIGTLIVGGIRLEAGLFAAAVGFSALSMRCATIGEVLRTASDRASGTGGQTIFYLLGLELLFLYSFIMLCWSAIWALQGQGVLKGDHLHDSIEPKHASIGEGLMALGIQVLITGIMLMILCRSDAKAQAMCSVLIACGIGGFAAFMFQPVRPSGWYLCGPLVVGLIGYLSASFGPESWRIGHLNGVLGALARPLPLDYASFGPAGAILGYWMGRKWQADAMEDLKTSATS